MKILNLHIITENEWQELQSRITDIERHFAVERDPKTGEMTKSLAEVPVEERAQLKRNVSRRRASWPQMRAWLEETDGGRRT